jgi:two-component system osmolarity sensor histidine kinase EnvZ
MDAFPATMFGRLGLLIAAVALSLMLIMALALRAFGLGPSGGIYADLVVGNVRLAQAVGDGALPGNLERVAQAPENSRAASLPAQLLILQRVRQAFGDGSRARFSNERVSRVWIQPAGANQWIGVRVPAFFLQTLSLGFLVLVFATIAVLFAAWWFARHLSKPLERLAANARTLAASEQWHVSDDRNAPREVREVQSALAQAASELRRSARERELLLAGVSHDLRTPLSRLRLAVELQSGVPPAERELMVGDIEEMDAIVGQFLDYVRDGRDEAEEIVDLVGMLHDLKEAAARDGMDWDLSATVPEHLPIRCRAMALRRALRNLMRNAQIHGAPPLMLEMQLSPDAPAAPKQVTIIVRDHGPGLPPPVLQNLGQPFVRASADRGGAPGSGLGLSLVQRVAQAHGGELTVATPAGGGFQARLSLPLRSA